MARVFLIFSMVQNLWTPSKNSKPFQKGKMKLLSGKEDNETIEELRPSCVEIQWLYAT